VDRDLIREYGEDVAVVIGTGSTVPDLEAFLGSLRAATARPVQVVVVTGPAGAGVPDGVRELRTAEDLGGPAAANRAVSGLDAAVGRVVLADPRVRWRPGALDALLDAAARHPRAGALGPRLLDPAGAVLPSGGALPSVADALRGRVRTAAGAGPVGWLSAACLLLRRAAWDSVGGFDSRYPGRDGAAGPALEMADVDLGDRLGRSGWLLLPVPAAEVTFSAVPGAGGGLVGGADRQGILESRGDGLRRYVRHRRRGPVRALVALADRARRS
jgi:N-acetylglucosaminyl-diphospho-decaprenol L-rhamnosyltransferase